MRKQPEELILQLQQENQALRAQLREAEERLNVIRRGEVELELNGHTGPDVSNSLKTEDESYRHLLEQMLEGAMTLSSKGIVLYCNPYIAHLLNKPLELLIGDFFLPHVSESKRGDFQWLLKAALRTAGKGEFSLLRSDGMEVPVYVSASSYSIAGNQYICLVITDLTLQKKNEEIVAAEKLARSILENATEAIVVCDMEGMITHTSGAFNELCGFNAIDNPVRELLHSPENNLPQEIYSYIKSALDGNVVKDSEVCLTLSAQERKPFLLSAGPLYGAQNEVIGCILILTDISTQKRNEEALRESELRFRSIFDQAAVGIAQSTAEGHFIQVNQRLCAILGYSQEELLRSRYSDVTHPQDWEKNQYLMKMLISNELDHYSLENRYIRKDGKIIWGNLTCSRYESSAGEVFTIGIIEDVTQNKEAELALLEVESIHKTISDAIPYGMWRCDAEGKCTYVTQAFLYLVGAPIEEVLEYGWLNRVHEEDRGPLLNKWQECVRTGKEWNNIYRILGVDGEYHSLLTMGRPVSDTSGNISSWVGIHLDITEREKFEADLRQISTELSAVVQSIPDALYVGDGQQFSRCNQAALQQLGFESLEELNRNLDKLTELLRIRCVDTGEWVRAEHNPFARALRGESFVQDIMIRHLRTGEELILRCASAPILQNGRNIGSVSIHANITDRRQAELRLIESQERLLAALSASGTSTFRWDIRTNAIDFDENLLNLIGRSREDLPSTLEDFVLLVHPDDRQSILDAIENCAQSGADFDMEFRFERKGEPPRWLSAKGKTFVDDEGRPLYMTGACVDFSNLKEVEKRLQELNESLEQRVRERTLSLVDHQQKLRRLASELTLTEQQERRHLASELHDYLAQLLVVCSMKASRLEKYVEHEKGQMLIQEIQEVVQESMTYTRTLIAELSPNILYESGLSAAVHWLGSQMEKHGLSVRVVSKNEIKKIPDDLAILIFQSIRELLFNVVKHAEAKESVVHLEMEESQQLIVKVIDQGKGFDVSTTRISYTGNGKFGLFNIRERLEALGGRMEIRSHPGEGTEIIIQIPMISEFEQFHYPEPNSETLVQHKDRSPLVKMDDNAIRVMLADDHDMVREGLCNVINSFSHYSVIGEASNGEEAVELTRRLHPHVVIMDLNMPKMNGIDATRIIKQEFPHIVVIGLSIHDDKEMMKAMKDAGVTSYITKGGPSEELLKALNAAFNRKGY